MSFFGFLKNQVIDIIEWNQESSGDVIAWRFPRADNEIKNGAKLIVREGQVAIFVNMGQLADVFTPGMHTLETKNLPILSTLMGWKYGFESPFKAEVYFISMRRFTDQKWGTQNPMMMRDREFGPVRIRAYGTYTIQVSNPVIFLRELISTDPEFRAMEISNQLRNVIVARVTDALASAGIPVLDMAANMDELSTVIGQRVAPDIDALGLKLPMLLIENISLPPEVEQALDKRTKMGIIGNLDQYMKFQAADSLPDAMKSQGGLASTGAGLAAGLAMGHHFVQAFQPGAPPAGAAPPPLPGGPPPLPQAAPWFAAINGAQSGPLSPGEFEARVAAGQINRETLIWRQGMAAWSPAKDVPEAANALAGVPPPLG